LTALSWTLGRPATLADFPDDELDRLAERGFDWLWLLGVWQTGPAGRDLARAHRERRGEWLTTLPDLDDSDICGSCFAVTGYAVSEALGGNPALASLRQRMNRRGLRLMLDFIPNHTALDHPWVEAHPDFYVQANERDLARLPGNYVAVRSDRGSRVVAHGRDPHFPGWPDTLQLDYGNPALREAMSGELLKVAEMCDGLRCDMAMLVLPEVFGRTWGVRSEPFWPVAIPRVRRVFPDFLFLAEVYWDLEWTLQHRVSTSPTTRPSTTDCVEGRRGPSRRISAPESIFKAGWRAFWKTTTSLERRLSFPPARIGPPRSSPFFPPVCPSSIKVSSRVTESTFRSSSVADRGSRWIQSWAISTRSFSPSCGGRACGREIGSSSRAPRPERAPTRATSSLSPGRGRTPSKFVWRSTTPLTGASAPSGFRSPRSQEGNGG
jgi:hypothetical protein